MLREQNKVSPVVVDVVDLGNEIVLQHTRSRYSPWRALGSYPHALYTPHLIRGGIT